MKTLLFDISETGATVFGYLTLLAFLAFVVVLIVGLIRSSRHRLLRLPVVPLLWTIALMVVFGSLSSVLPKSPDHSLER